MLVYANNLQLEPEEGVDQIIQIIAKWVGKKSGPGSFVDPQKLLQGIKELKLKDGSVLVSRSTFDSSDSSDFPRFISARFSHSDSAVAGRRWTTEIGLRQDLADSPIDCSILLRTDEVSARVNSSVTVTRPTLVLNLFEKCRPTQITPGLFLKTLDLFSIDYFLKAVTNEERRRPIVVISADPSGNYLIPPERVRSIVLGLAEVFEIPPSTDTFQLQNLIGRRFISYGGAIRLIFPKNPKGDYYESPVITSDKLVELATEHGAIESEILSIITHRMNVPLSYRHISIEFVNQVNLRAKLRRAVETARASTDTKEQDYFVELLELADTELSTLYNDLTDKNDECRKLQAAVDGLQFALSEKQSGNTLDEQALATLQPIRATFRTISRKELTLEDALRTCAALFPDRLVVLDSAYASAKESDRSGFLHSEKALDLLIKLVADYWSMLNEGGSDQQAKAIFGNDAYAPNEAGLSKDGRKRREFRYNGTAVQMDKHLKHGVKESVAATLRIHFEWFAEPRNFVIGHCGKHLDF